MFLWSPPLAGKPLNLPKACTSLGWARHGLGCAASDSFQRRQLERKGRAAQAVAQLSLVVFDETEFQDVRTISRSVCFGGPLPASAQRRKPRGWVPTEPLARSIQLGPFGVGIYIMNCLWMWFKLLFILLKSAFIYLWWSAFPWRQIPKLWERTVKIRPSCQLVCLPSASTLWVDGPSCQRSFVYILANTCIFFSSIIHKWRHIKKIALHLLFKKKLNIFWWLPHIFLFF